MDCATGEVMMALAGARQRETFVAPRGPAMHHGGGHVGMKLEAERMIEAERFDRKIASLRQQFAPGRQLKALAMPMIDVIRPVRADGAAGGGGTDWIVPDLPAAFRMARHPGAELPRQHLRAEANAQQWPLLPKRHGDPVDLAANEVIGIVGAHRAAENDGAGVPLQRFRQAIAKARTLYVQRIS